MTIRVLCFFSAKKKLKFNIQKIEERSETRTFCYLFIIKLNLVFSLAPVCKLIALFSTTPSFLKQIFSSV